MKIFLLVLIAIISLGNILTLVVLPVNIATASEKGFNDGFTNAKNLARQATLYQNSNGFFGILQNVILFLMSLVAIVAVAALIWGGLMYIMSLGDEQRSATAKKIILYAIIGILVAGTAFLVIQIIDTLLTAP